MCGIARVSSESEKKIKRKKRRSQRAESLRNGIRVKETKIREETKVN